MALPPTPVLTGRKRRKAMPYSHFTREEREELQELLGRRLKCKEVALRLDKDPTSVAREVKRNRKFDGRRHGCSKRSTLCSRFRNAEVKSFAGSARAGGARRARGSTARGRVRASTRWSAGPRRASPTSATSARKGRAAGLSATPTAPTSPKRRRTTTPANRGAAST